MGHFDIRTIIFGQLALSVVCAPVIWLLWRQNRQRYEGLSFWVANYSLQIVNLFLILLRGTVPDFLSMVVSNTAGVGALLCLYEGFGRFLGKTVRHRLNLAMLAVFAAIHYYFAMVRPDFPARNLNFNFFLLFFCLRNVNLLMRGASQEFKNLVRPPAYSLMGFALVSLLRVGVTLFGHPAADFFNNGGMDAFLLLLYSTLLVLLTFSLFLMVNSRLIADKLAEHEGRRAAEAGLKASEGYFRMVVENAPEAIFIQSEGRFVYLNTACCALLGITEPGEVLGKDFMPFIAPDYRQLVLERVQLQRATGKSAPLVEMEYLRADGSPVPVESIAMPVQFSGRPSHLVFVRDITERRRAYSALQTAQKLESLGTLAGGIAHDFNNLLTGIAGNLSLIRAGAERGDIPALVREAETACLSAEGLARQLLTFSSGGEPVKASLDLPALVKEGLAFSLRGSRVNGQVDAAGGIFVLADRDQLFQVVQNLAANAVQAMGGAGAIRISVAVTELKYGEVPPLSAGRYARLEVSDTGPGIPAEQLHRVFDPYYSTKGKGRGLGLAVCRSIILKHGGQITASSGNGGAVFEIYLPLAETPAAITDRSLKRELKKGSGRVLVMDDEEVVYKALRRMLSALGYEVEITVTGEKALEAWQAARAAGRPFAAVIMDLTVAGGMGGAEAVKRLLELDPAAKAIVSSGYADDPVLAEYKNYGFAGTLSKPYRLEDLCAVLAELIG